MEVIGADSRGATTFTNSYIEVSTRPLAYAHWHIQLENV